MDDIVSWCKTGLQELNSLAQDRRRWKLITRQAMDTNGHRTGPMVPEEEVVLVTQLDLPSVVVSVPFLSIQCK